MAMASIRQTPALLNLPIPRQGAPVPACPALHCTLPHLAPSHLGPALLRVRFSLLVQISIFSPTLFACHRCILGPILDRTPLLPRVLWHCPGRTDAEIYGMRWDVKRCAVLRFHTQQPVVTSSSYFPCRRRHLKSPSPSGHRNKHPRRPDQRSFSALDSNQGRAPGHFVQPSLDSTTDRTTPATGLVEGQPTGLSPSSPTTHRPSMHAVSPPSQPHHRCQQLGTDHAQQPAAGAGSMRWRSHKPQVRVSPTVSH